MPPQRRREQRDQAALRAARRAAKESAQGKRRVLPKAITAPSRRAQVEFAYRVMRGEEPYPVKGSPESKQLARMASYARWNKVDPAFLTAFQQYFYHDEKRSELNEADIEDMSDYEEDEEK